MALDNYTDLQAAVANWLARGDLTAVIPDFIALAETEITRRLRRITLVAPLTIDSEFNSLPSDCAELRSLRLSTGIPTADTPIIVGTVEQLAYHRARHANTAGRPKWAAVYNGAVQVVPTPDQTYQGLITYYQELLPLGPTNATNPTLTESPDLYLYGTLMQASAYLEDDARIPTWEAKFEKAINQINIIVDREEFGASIKQARLPRVF